METIRKKNGLVLPSFTEFFFDRLSCRFFQTLPPPVDRVLPSFCGIEKNGKLIAGSTFIAGLVPVCSSGNTGVPATGRRVTELFLPRWREIDRWSHEKKNHKKLLNQRVRSVINCLDWPCSSGNRATVSISPQKKTKNKNQTDLTSTDVNTSTQIKANRKKNGKKNKNSSLEIGEKLDEKRTKNRLD